MRSTSAPQDPIRVEQLIPPDAIWIVHCRPAELWAHRSVRVALAPAIAERDLEAFRDRTGVDLTKLQELAVGGFGDAGELIALRGPAVAESMERVLAATVRRSYSIAKLRNDIVLVATGGHPPELLAKGQARSRGARSENATTTRIRSALPGTPFQLIYPGALNPDRDASAAVLLSGVTSAGTAMIPRGAFIEAQVTLFGDFPSSAEENFRELVQSVASSPLGEVFGLRATAMEVQVRTQAGRVDIELALPAMDIAEGVRTLFVAQTRELLTYPARPLN